MAFPLLMDVDTGIDDALALLLAVRSPELDLVGVGTVAGNVGAAAPLLEPWADVAWIHGDDGMGNSAQPPPAGAPAAEDAVHQLLRLSHEHAGRLLVVAIGPLTNLALALRLDPSLPSRIGRLVIMGGSVRHGGNRGAWTVQVAAFLELLRDRLVRPPT